VGEGVVIQAARRRTLYHDRDIFTAWLEPIKKSAQPWRFPPGISALADRIGSESTRRINQSETKSSTSSKTFYGI
jgi:hypothetical protein